MDERYSPYKPLILRIFLGLMVIMWGYEKLVVEKLAKSYTLDYGSLMMIDVQTFLQAAGWIQIAMGILVLLGLLTRSNALVFTLMGLITIIIPGVVMLKDVPHFAYAFAFTGASLAMWLDGGGRYSLDRWIERHKLRKPQVIEDPCRSQECA